MRKLVLRMLGGFGLAAVCGFVGLAHLSATLATLVIFCAGLALVSRLLALTDYHRS